MAETKVEGKKQNPFKTFVKTASKFFRDCKGEIKKIVWPTRQTVFKNMGVVVLTIFVAGLFIFALDTIFQNILALVMDLA